ncbi:MAG: hypothetical protein U0X92_08490 [Anaerolineales bacterium]
MFVGVGVIVGVCVIVGVSVMVGIKVSVGVIVAVGEGVSVSGNMQVPVSVILSNLNVPLAPLAPYSNNRKDAAKLSFKPAIELKSKDNE